MGYFEFRLTDKNSVVLKNLKACDPEFSFHLEYYREFDKRWKSSYVTNASDFTVGRADDLLYKILEKEYERVLAHLAKKSSEKEYERVLAHLAKKSSETGYIIETNGNQKINEVVLDLAIKAGWPFAESYRKELINNATAIYINFSCFGQIGFDINHYYETQERIPSKNHMTQLSLDEVIKNGIPSPVPKKEKVTIEVEAPAGSEIVVSVSGKVLKKIQL